MDLNAYARQQAAMAGIDPDLVSRVMSAESGGNPFATSKAGARGPMQLMPATAQSLGVNIDDPLDNIRGGVRYLAKQMKTFGDPSLALAAYNAGPGNVRKYGGVPPFAETQGYVRKIMGSGASANPFDQFDGQAQKAQAAQKGASNPFDQFDNTQSQPVKPRLKVIDNTIPPANPLEGMNALQRGAVGAGKAATDFLDAIGLAKPLGLHRLEDDVKQPTLSSLITGQKGPSAQQQALDALNSDPAAIVGNIGGQIGIGYLGGRALQGAGAAVRGAMAGRDLTTAGKVVQAAGNAATKAGNAIINPTGVKQAAAAGAGLGAVTTPGDFSTRAEAALGGAVGGTLGAAVGKGVGRVANIMRPASDVSAAASQASANIGIDFPNLPRGVQDQISRLARNNVNDISQLSPDIVQRLSDFESLGIRPVKGWVNRDANDWWTQNTLNTVSPEIAQRTRDANNALVQAVGRNTADASNYQIGQNLTDAVTSADRAMQYRANELYNGARSMSGRDIQLDPHRFVNNATNELDQQMIGGKLPSDTLNWFARVTSGQEPFDMGTALQRLQAINGRIYGTNDPAEATALRIVKRHLTDAIEGYGGPNAGGLPRVGEDEQRNLSEAFREARQAAARRFQFQESNPLIENIISGRFTSENLPKMIGSMRTNDLAGLADVQQQFGVPVMDSLRDAARAYIRDSSTLQSETGGTFSVAGLRRALDKIGPEKGRVLFGPEWDQYSRILRAGGNIYNPPTRPANSATASNALRFIKDMPIPGAGPAINIALKAGAAVKQANQVGNALDYGLGAAGSPIPAGLLPLFGASSLIAPSR